MGPVVTAMAAETSDSVILHLPTPALPGQVLTVDSPSCPLSALGVRSRVVDSMQASAAQQRLPTGNRNCPQLLCIANIYVLLLVNALKIRK
jgi:hypothetical protein